MESFYRVSVEEQTNRLNGFATRALERWGVTGCEPELLKYRENAVFRVTTPDGQPAALRVHRHGYHSDDALRSELAWMEALRANGLTFRMSTLEKSLFAVVSAIGVPAPRQVDMLEWLTGQPLGTLENGLSETVVDVRKAFAQVGQLAARLHVHAATWSPPWRACARLPTSLSRDRPRLLSRSHRYSIAKDTRRAKIERPDHLQSEESSHGVRLLGCIAEDSLNCPDADS
jgi:Ser/Thr protein kinase RdoA (MazF antagonist)